MKNIYKKVAAGNYPLPIIDDPNKVTFDNNYYESIYRYVYTQYSLNKKQPYLCIDFYDFEKKSSIDLAQLVDANKIKVDKNKKNIRQRNILPFFQKYPMFYNFFKNLHTNADISIKSAELILGVEVNDKNFIEIKTIIDEVHASRWIKALTNSEQQAGKSILGNISEGLIRKALHNLIDDENFLKNNNEDVSCYGDFVLMCLPNNLWISVKSNFAKERLLVSGFGTDIIGVGFFVDSKEFTAGSRVTNHQRAGFLAIYLPDISVDEDQIRNNTDTYSEVEKHYSDLNTAMPVNNNGEPFYRKLSDLYKDIQQLLSQQDIKKRTTIGF